MFGKRLLITLRVIRTIFLYIMGAGTMFVVLWWVCTLPDSKTTEYISNIIIGAFGVLFGLLIAICILAYVCRYINWQFVQPYKDWKSRRRNHVG